MTRMPALLLIDIGNTRIKWAWCAPGSGADTAAGAPGGLAVPWEQSGARPHADIAQLVTAWRSLAAGGPAPAVWISNVAGPVLAGAVDAALADAFGAPPATVNWQRSVAHHGLLDNGYREPTQLGVDRWLAAIGARHAVPDGHLLIVTAGTATTIDVVTASAGRSRFEGGLILPGLALMMGSLARNTAQLPAVEVSDTGGAAPWADHTRGAIAAGCLAAQTGAIAQTWQALARRGPVRGLLSGGARDALARALTLPFTQHENLVLLGLWVVAMGRTTPAARP